MPRKQASPAKQAGAKEKKTEPIRWTKHKIRDRRFAEEYVASAGDGKRAVRAAGLKSKNTAVAACEMLDREGVQSELSEMMSEIRKDKVLTAEAVMERISEQAVFDPLPYMFDDGSVDLGALANDNKGHLVESFSTSSNPNTGIVKAHVKFHSQQRALFLLAECYGLRQTPKANELDAVRAGVKAYMQTQGCTLEDALQQLPARFPIVARYAPQLLREGVMV